ncbi:MAG: multicopper oxidase domain-containing protein [Cyclobacteriaceae bacterium]
MKNLLRKKLPFMMVMLILMSCGGTNNKTEKRPRAKISDRLQSEIQSIKSNFKNASGNEDLIHLPFENPKEIVSSNGKLDTQFDIAFATNELYNTEVKSNISLRHRSYNGKLVGPTLRVKPGDSLLVNLVNNLPAYGKPEPCDPYVTHSDGVDPNYIDTMRFNRINLHTHGLHVSPMGQGDNIFVNLTPGCSFQNRIGIPTNHATGTFWYHPHVHGSTAIQVSSGMGGAIIIEGGLDTLDLIREMEEKIFVLQQMPYIPDSASGNPDRYAIKFLEDTTFGPGSWEAGIKNGTGWRTTVNGQVLPVIEMESEEVQRWRFIHAGVRETINLRLARTVGDSIEFSLIYAIAQDGIAYGYRSDVDSMILQPGYRADLLIQEFLGDVPQDTLYLVDGSSTELYGENNESSKVLAVIVLKPKSGKPIATTLPSSEMLTPYAPYPSLVDKEVTDLMEYVNFVIIPESWPEANDTTRFQINGVAFDHLNPPRTLTLNKIQEWTLTSSLADHPFHIHVNHFQLMKKWHRSSPTDPWIEQEISHIWKDTYFVEQNDSIIIKTVYKDFIGDFVIHCHILDHEDQGMMQCVRVDSAGVINNYLLDNGIKFCGPEYNNSLSSLTK